MQTLLEAPVRRVQATRPVRVSFVIDNLSRAGTESQLLALIAQLDRDRVEPSLVILDGESPASRELEPIDCPVLRLGVRKLFGPKAVSAAWKLRQFWAAKPDIVTAYFLDSAYFAVPVAKLMGVKKVLRVRNNLGYWLTRKHRVLNRVIRPWVDGVLTNSAAGQAAMIAADGLASGQVHVIENGVNIERFAGFPAPFTRPTIRIGCVANLRAVKNIDGLMKAAKWVLEEYPDAQFLVAGEGDERPALERLHAELALGNHFQLLGSVADVPGFLRTLDVCVLPSHSEGMSNALLEFAAAGRAIIATDVGANATILEDGISGVIVPPGNVSRLAQAITHLIQHPHLARSYGEAARQTVAANHSREAMVARFEDFFCGCV
jgi:L-malate glycosyltransferase